MRQRDKYINIADYYDQGLVKNLDRENFFKAIFQKNKVKKLLDCACGTGRDLLLFNSLGFNATGSDISESMLKVAWKKIHESSLKIPLFKADFQTLNKTFSQKFDAVVCLSNSINEIENDVVKTLNSMKSVLNKYGIIIFDQGQTDFSMRNPPKYSLEVNNRDFSRLYTMNYVRDIMTVNVFDIIHKKEEDDFRYSKFEIKVRLYDDWKEILDKVSLSGEFYGSWHFDPYDKASSRRLIVLARKIN